MNENTQALLQYIADKEHDLELQLEALRSIRALLLEQTKNIQLRNRATMYRQLNSVIESLPPTAISFDLREIIQNAKYVLLDTLAAQLEALDAPVAAEDCTTDAPPPDDPLKSV